MERTVRNNTAKSRYEMVVGESVAFANYHREGDVVRILHVETPPELRGGGMAGQLMTGVVESARTEGLKIYPICPYAVAWFKRHPEQADILKQ